MATYARKGVKSGGIRQVEVHQGNPDIRLKPLVDRIRDHIGACKVRLPPEASAFQTVIYNGPCLLLGETEPVQVLCGDRIGVEEKGLDLPPGMAAVNRPGRSAVGGILSDNDLVRGSAGFHAPRS